MPQYQLEKFKIDNEILEPATLLLTSILPVPLDLILVVLKFTGPISLVSGDSTIVEYNLIPPSAMIIKEMGNFQRTTMSLISNIKSPSYKIMLGHNKAILESPPDVSLEFNSWGFEIFSKNLCFRLDVHDDLTFLFTKITQQAERAIISEGHMDAFSGLAIFGYDPTMFEEITCAVTKIKNLSVMHFRAIRTMDFEHIQKSWYGRLTFHCRQIIFMTSKLGLIRFLIEVEQLAFLVSSTSP